MAVVVSLVIKSTRFSSTERMQSSAAGAMAISHGTHAESFGRDLLLISACVEHNSNDGACDDKQDL